MKKIVMKNCIALISFVFALTVTWQVNAKDINQAELQKVMKTNKHVVLLDVRTTEEFAQGHIPNAINIPHKALESRLAELSAAKDSQVVIYCRSGRRAEVARKILAANGFTQLDHLMGDFNGWASNGLPINK